MELKSHLCPQTVNEPNRGNNHLVVFAPITAEGFSPVCRNGQPAGSRFHIPNSQCPVPYSNRDEHQLSSIRPLNLLKSHKISHINFQFAISAESSEPWHSFQGPLALSMNGPRARRWGNRHWPVLCTLHGPPISTGNFSSYFFFFWCLLSDLLLKAQHFYSEVSSKWSNHSLFTSH